MWGKDLIELAQDRDSWWSLLNAVMNSGVPRGRGGGVQAPLEIPKFCQS
jgi:hypothetical protein